MAVRREPDPAKLATAVQARIGPPMRLDLLSRILFIIYCVEAGAVFFLVPWGPAWDRLVVQVGSESIRSVLLHPTFRSLITAFGGLHLVWAVNDLDLLLTFWRTRRQAAAQNRVRAQ